MSNEVVYLDELLDKLEIYGINTGDLIIIETEESE